MLELTVEGELYDESENEFITVGPRTVRFEHSLLSVSKWESIWRKPFLDDESKSIKETRSYFRCMAIDDISDTELDLIMLNHFPNLIITSNRRKRRPRSITCPKDVVHHPR